MEEKQFMALLRSVKFETTRIYPEPKDSDLDWPMEDKLDFYTQSFALNAIERKEGRSYAFAEFKLFFETLLNIELEAIKTTYSFDDCILFSRQMRIDDDGNLYFLLSTGI